MERLECSMINSISILSMLERLSTVWSMAYSGGKKGACSSTPLQEVFKQRSFRDKLISWHLLKDLVHQLNKISLLTFLKKQSYSLSSSKEKLTKVWKFIGNSKKIFAKWSLKLLKLIVKCWILDIIQCLTSKEGKSLDLSPNMKELDLFLKLSLSYKI